MVLRIKGHAAVAFHSEITGAVVPVMLHQAVGKAGVIWKENLGLKKESEVKLPLMF